MTNCLRWWWFGTFMLVMAGMLIFSRFETHVDEPNSIATTPIFNATLETIVEAEAKTGDTRVRTGPSTDTHQLGLIQPPGTRYRVIGRRFNWYQIEYPASPTGVAWVNSFVVNVTGDTSLIPEINPMVFPTITPVKR